MSNSSLSTPPGLVPAAADPLDHRVHDDAERVAAVAVLARLELAPQPLAHGLCDVLAAPARASARRTVDDRLVPAREQEVDLAVREQSLVLGIPRIAHRERVASDTADLTKPRLETRRVSTVYRRWPSRAADSQETKGETPCTNSSLPARRARRAPRDRRRTALPAPRPASRLRHRSTRRSRAASASARVDEAGSVPELVVAQPARRTRAALRRRGARRREAEPHPQRHRPRRGRREPPIPVSCVEQGRWRAHEPTFTAGDNVSHSHLRRSKAQALAARPLERGVAQGDVWHEVQAKQERMGVRSPTATNRDTFAAHADALRSLEQAFAPQQGQCGAVLGLDDELCLDAVSRPDAFALLWPKLRAGYLLDALERLDGRAASVEQVGQFAAAVGGARATRGPRPGSEPTCAFGGKASSAPASSSTGS